MRRASCISVFWEKTELPLFSEWQWPIAYMSESDESGCADGKLPAFVLVGEV